MLRVGCLASSIFQPKVDTPDSVKVIATLHASVPACKAMFSAWLTHGILAHGYSVCHRCICPIQDAIWAINTPPHCVFNQAISYHTSCILSTLIRQACRELRRLTEKEGADNMMHSAVRPYLMDLGSANGTYLNNERIEGERYYELLERVSPAGITWTRTGSALSCVAWVDLLGSRYSWCTFA